MDEINKLVAEATESKVTETIKGTVREEIKSRLKINGSDVQPNRTEEEAKKAVGVRSILDQEFSSFLSNYDYKSVSLDDLTGFGEEKESSEAESADNLIGHTDAIEFEGKRYPVIVAKTTTEVLNKLPDGKYMQIQFLVEFHRSDSATLEGKMRDFVPRHADLPKSRVSTKLENGLVVVEPNLNGFKITALMEDLDDVSYHQLDNLNKWIELYQGALLESTLEKMKDRGVDEWDMARSQVTIGLISRARRVFESKKARMEAAEGETPVITPAIRRDSAIFANELNDLLNLLPLTGSTVRFGTQVSIIEVTTDKKISDSWKSARGNFSYFKKGESAGRINRVSGSLRSTPITSEMEEQVARNLSTIIPSVLTIFENVVREQIGIEKLDVIELPEVREPKTSNIQELFGLDPKELAALEGEYLDRTDREISNHFKNAEVKQIGSILGLLRKQEE